MGLPDTLRESPKDVLSVISGKIAPTSLGMGRVFDGGAKYCNNHMKVAEVTKVQAIFIQTF